MEKKKIICLEYCKYARVTGNKCETCENNPNMRLNFELSEDAKQLMEQEILSDPTTLIESRGQELAEMLKKKVQEGAEGEKG